ncbi:exported hypothetical protein [Candidatus Sulfopaludibacter sp. SbA6]|nr:exported hypothetical protein [Candidatus Sulfopaludibacter sp. SbA6]
MIARTSRLLRGAVSTAIALSAFFPVLSTGQTTATVSSNPRAPSDDPRVGLKPGLYDAGEAAFGMERLASLSKPHGFAPGCRSRMASRPAMPSALPPHRRRRLRAIRSLLGLLPVNTVPPTPIWPSAATIFL